MRVLITGHLGFLGQSLCQYIRYRAPKVEIFEMDRCRGIQEDVRFRDRLSPIVERISPDLIYHLASPSSQVMFSEEPTRMLTETIVGVVNVLEAAKGIPVIIPSTSSLYGVTNDYAKAKAVVEGICANYPNARFKRIFAGYGPNESHKGESASVIYQWLLKVKDEEPIEIWGDGTQSRDFVYQDDIAKCLVEGYSDLDIGTGISTTFNEVIEIIKEVTDLELKVIYKDKPINYLEQTKSPTSNCKTSLREGIRKTWESMNNHEY